MGEQREDVLGSPSKSAKHADLHPTGNPVLSKGPWIGEGPDDVISSERYAQTLGTHILARGRLGKTRLGILRCS